MGYVQTGKVEHINEKMDIVFYEKIDEEIRQTTCSLSVKALYCTGTFGGSVV